ncbi:leukocyte receptor cluster member 9 isoform X2 [Myripristis murdjan]|uniref:leukocyte receptor cluster member 9 isoform X2 n=1 Tax=Myripristis murdjan TaxID=586833 RepID=UPI001175CDF8|nr:leukocyte receptor cluster member 9 isoform X2 [Myripristis murdjan]
MASGVSPSGSPREQSHGSPASSSNPSSSDPEDPAGPNAGTDTPDTTAATESAEQGEDGVTVCQFFLMGKCHFAHRCRLSHSPSSDDPGAGLPDQDDMKDEEKVDKNKKRKGKGTKAAKPKYTEGKELNKKPRMRTADDVISRILWDPSVEASEFVVGYVDRFLGVLERPFSEFNWDTNPCDCDYSAELALPRHRIQYFLYRGHRVWDRNSRTDRVFGSTGQSLAPPFGGEEEVKKTSTNDTEELKLETLTLMQEITQDQLSTVSGQVESERQECAHTESTHLEEEKQNEMNIHTHESTQAPLKFTGTTHQGQQEAGGESSAVEEAADGLLISTDQRDRETGKQEGQEETLEEWKEDWEDDEESARCHLGVFQSSSAPVEQRENKRGGRPPKKRPTHFITFKANTPAILSCFQQLQEELITLLPSSAPYWVTPPSLHVTLCLLVLPGPAEVAAAGETLRRFAHLDRNPPVAVSFPLKLKHFNGKVLFLSPQPQLHLQQLNSGLQEAYREKGVLHRDSFNPRYHLTLAKVDADGDRIFEGVGDLKVGKGLNFGRLPVNTLHLCAMGMREDGFYETLCTVTLR